MNDDKLHDLTDQELLSKISGCERARQRIVEAPTVEHVGERVREWLGRAVARTTTQLNALTPALIGENRLEEQLNALGISVLLCTPTASKEIEAAVLERLAKGIMTEAQQQERIDEITAEEDAYSTELARRRAEPDREQHDRIRAVGRDTAEAKIVFVPKGRNSVVCREVNGVRSQLGGATEWWQGSLRRNGPWQLRAELVGGDAPSGQLDRWLSIERDERSWSLRQSGAGSKRARLQMASSRLTVYPNRKIASTAIFDLVAEVAVGG